MSNAIKETIDGLEISLHKAGNYTMPGMHYHDAYEIYLLEEGDRSYMLEDKLVYVRPRDVLLIRRNMLHCSVGGKYVSTLITFGKKYLSDFFSEHGIDLITKCFEKTQLRLKEDDFALVIALTERLKEDGEDIFALTQILDILKNNMSRKPFDIKSSNHLAAEIVDYVTENYNNIDNLEALASKFYISVQHLCNSFKKYTNTTIVKYINILKIHHSFEFLSQKDLTIAEVAEKSGFNNLQYFSNMFKSITGVSPMSYRKNGLPKSKP